MAAAAEGGGGGGGGSGGGGGGGVEGGERQKNTSRSRWAYAMEPTTTTTNAPLASFSLLPFL